MSNKPRIWAHCDAGCKWETVHKDDFLKSCTLMKMNADNSGKWYIESGKQYKIMSENVVGVGYGFSITFKYKDNGSETAYNFTIPHEDKYANYVVFKLLEASAVDTTLTLVYEIAGVRYIDEISGTSISLIEKNYLYIENADSVLLYNDDASFIIEAKDGKDGLDGSGINPNLLINGDFRVNQRGQTGQVASSGYTFDRWQFNKNGDGYLDIENKVMSNGTTGTYTILQQRIELDPTIISGKTITFSTDISVISGRCALVIAYSSGSTINQLASKNIYPTDSSGRFSISTTVPTELNSNNMLMVRIVGNNNNGQANFNFSKAKLEIGNVATAFTPRPYAEELAMCQRYYQKLINPMCIGRTAYSDDTNGSIFVNIPVTMRPKYSITFDTNPVCYGSGQSTTATSITFSAQRENGFKMNVVLPTGLGTRQVLEAEGVVYTIDAEIY